MVGGTKQKIETLMDLILPLLRQICAEPFSLGLGGSVAKGTADEHADLDLYIFSEKWIPLNEAEGLFREAEGVEHVTTWESSEEGEGGIDFKYNGTDVECWFRCSSVIEKELNRLLKGDFESKVVSWTPSGFHSYTLLSDLHSLVPLADDYAVLENWQKDLNVYPEDLSRKIIEVNKGILYFWKDNFHLESAFKRDDIVYLSSILLQGIHAVIQILFAQNRVYFPGDKKLLEKVEALPDKPRETCRILRELLMVKAGRKCFDNLYLLASKIVKAP